MSSSLANRCSRPFVFTAASFVLSGLLSAQLTDQTQTPNAAGAGILKSFAEQIGAGRGDLMTPGSSIFIINRDPFRAIRRGRQIFQRKFTVAQGFGPRTNDGVGDIEADASHGAGLADSCAACHARPFGSAGFGGNVITRPKSRDAPHLFGLGLQEMLADEITADLRAIEAQAIADAMSSGSAVFAKLNSKGLNYGNITAMPDGSVDKSNVSGVNDDLRVRPFFAQGDTISIREFLVGAFNAEMGLEAFDPDMDDAANSMLDVTTPSGMVLSGSTDTIEAPVVTSTSDDSDGDGVTDEIPVSIVDFMEFYLLNYFKPGLGPQDSATMAGRDLMRQIGCTRCHVPDLTIDVDRRVADVETNFDAVQGSIFNRMFATATAFTVETDDGSGFPTLKQPAGGSFVVQNIFTDFRRHDLGPAFHELNYDGTLQTEFITEPLWGAGSTPPYGHDGRSATLVDVILRHGGDAQVPRDKFVALSTLEQRQMIAFLRSLVLFSPEDTPSNLNPADPMDPMFPIEGQGSISLAPLFNDPSEGE